MEGQITVWQALYPFGIAKRDFSIVDYINSPMGTEHIDYNCYRRFLEWSDEFLENGSYQTCTTREQLESSIHKFLSTQEDRKDCYLRNLPFEEDAYTPSVKKSVQNFGVVLGANSLQLPLIEMMYRKLERNLKHLFTSNAPLIIIDSKRK